jgi:hypothetical protein
MSDKKGTDKLSKKGTPVHRHMTREEFEGHLNELIEAFGEAELEPTGNGLVIRYPAQRCTAKTQKGKRCANTAKHGALCSVHHRMAQEEEAVELRKALIKTREEARAQQYDAYNEDDFIDSDVEMGVEEEEDDEEETYTPTYSRPPTKKPSGKR